MTVKASKVKRYVERIRQHQQNTLFETNQRKFYKQVDQLDHQKQPMPNVEETKLFWALPVERNKETAWLKDMKNQQVETQEDLVITVVNIRKQLKKLLNWKTPGTDNVQGFWLTTLKLVQGRIASQLQAVSMRDGYLSG